MTSRNSDLAEKVRAILKEPPGNSQRNNAAEKYVAHSPAIFRTMYNGSEVLPPKCVQIEITNRCSTHCKMCLRFTWEAQKGYDVRNELSTPRILELLKELAVAGVTTTIWTGGEPVTHPDFEILLENAKSLGLRIGVLSNGVGITASKAEAILGYTDWIRISLDDVPGAEKTIRILAADVGTVNITAEVEASLNHLRTAYRRHPESQCKIGFAYTIQNRNIYNVPHMVKYVSTSDVTRELGIVVNFKIAHGEGPFLCNEAQLQWLQKEVLSDRELLNNPYANLHYLANHYFPRLKLSDIAFGKPTRTYYHANRTICFTPYLFSLIDAQGGIYICCHLYDDNGLFNSEKRRTYMIGNLTTKRGSSLSGAGERLFGTANLKNPDNLAVKLREACDPLSKHLQECLSRKTLLLLREHSSSKRFTDNASVQRTHQKSHAIWLQEALVRDLNRILKGPCLFDSQRFKSVTLTEETQSLIAQNPQGEGLVYLNRRLLEEAYPNEIAKSYRTFMEAWRSAIYQNMRHKLHPIDVGTTPCSECTRHWIPNTVLTRLYEEIFLPMVESLGFDEAMSHYKDLVGIYPEEDVWF